MDDPYDVSLRKGFDALQRFFAGSDDLDTMLNKVALVAVETVPGCDFASITLVGRDGPTTATASDKAAITLDETQYEASDGPCLAAIRHQGVETVDVRTETRWPEFVQAARDLDVLGSLSLALIAAEDVRGGLNLYSRSTHRFPDQSIEFAKRFGDQLGLAAASVVEMAESAQLAEQLRQAMESRAVIEQAKGIIMAANRCSPEAAFDILRRASQHRNQKLREIAKDIVERTQRGLPS